MPKVNEVRAGVPASTSSQEGPSGNESRLAINLFDLTRINQVVRQAMGLAAKLDGKGGPIRVDRERPDETAVAFSCDLLTAAALCDVIRLHDRKVGDYPTRAYLKRRVWTRLPGEAVLTVVNSVGEVELSPEWFPEVAPAVELEFAPPKSIFEE